MHIHNQDSGGGDHEGDAEEGERASASALHESSARAVRTLVSRRVLSNHELRGLRPSRGSARAKHLNLLL